MSELVDRSLAEIQQLDVHDFEVDPETAVESALLDVARYGVAKLCNIGPVLTDDDIQAMSLWALRHAGKESFDGLIGTMADEINSRVDIFAPAFKSLFGKLSKRSNGGLTIQQMCLRQRKPQEYPDWHKDGRASASGLRAIFPVLANTEDSQSSFLVARRVYDYDPNDKEASKAIIDELEKDLPLDAHLGLNYTPRSAILMAEGGWE